MFKAISALKEPVITKRTARQNVSHVRSIFRELSKAAEKAMNSGPPAVVQLDPTESDGDDSDFEGFHLVEVPDRDDSFALFMGKYLDKGGPAK